MRAHPQTSTGKSWELNNKWGFNNKKGLTITYLIIHWPVTIRKAWELSEGQMISEGFITNVVWTKSESFMTSDDWLLNWGIKLYPVKAEW